MNVSEKEKSHVEMQIYINFPHGIMSPSPGYKLAVQVCS